ncbi:MAG: epoxyqueuosine reductase QueH [Candidatus Falkowbacteria bacterium]|nr:epoxyqueuosine reductase QueH [Candidatus Falkowbacteria bacterium]
MTKEKPSLLLHTCCMSCGANVVKELTENFTVTLYFYNPNIFPLAEYQKRLDETIRIAKDCNYTLIIEPYDHESWKKLTKGHELDREKGERCRICYHDRMKTTLEKANTQKFNYFSTTLTVSPHKDAKAIANIGLNLVKTNNVKFLDTDFKKNDGFKKAVQLSKELNLYRQEYCGCEFSIKK